MARILRLSGTNFTLSGLTTIKNPDLYNDTDFVNFYNAVIAAGTSPDSHIDAIASFIFNTKADGDWNKYNMFIPMIGNSLATALVYLRPSAGTSAAFTVTGTNPTYALTTGLTGAGTGYIDTGVLVSAVASTGVGAAIGCYPKTNGTVTVPAIGSSAGASGASSFGIYNNYSSTQASSMFSLVSTTVNPTSTPITNNKVVIGSRVASTSHKLYRDGAVVGTSSDPTQLGTIPSARTIKLFPAGTDTNTTGCNTIALGCAFVFNAPLSDADVARISPRIQTLMTALGR